MLYSDKVMNKLVNLLTEKQLRYMSPDKILPNHTCNYLAINDWEYDMLLIQIEKSFGVELSVTESQSIKNVGDMATILTKKIATKKYNLMRAQSAKRQH